MVSSAPSRVSQQGEAIELEAPAQRPARDPFLSGSLPREGAWWLVAASGLFITGFYKGINLLLLLAYLLVGALVVNWLLARKALRRVAARRLPTEPIVAGQATAWALAVHNHGSRPTRGWNLEDRGANHHLGWFVLRVEPGRSLELRCVVSFPRRGRYYCEPLRAWTRYPFGLVHQAVEMAPAEERIILPRAGAVHGDRLRHWLARATRGDGRVNRRLRHVAAQEADVHGLRVFRPGDSPRWIHWKTSARRNEWMVREFEDSAPPHLVLVVEPWLPEKPAAVDTDRLEAVISMAAGVCREWCREPGSRLTLVLARPEPVIIDGSTTAAHGLRTLEALALEPGGPAVEPADWLLRMGRLAATPLLVLSSRRDGDLADRLVGILGRPVARVQPGEQTAWYNPPSEQQ
jgi:uncharacterized protein (DUF58 family)